mgnify:CR=1 FL=1
MFFLASQNFVVPKVNFSLFHGMGFELSIYIILLITFDLGYYGDFVLEDPRIPYSTLDLSYKKHLFSHVNLR